MTKVTRRRALVAGGAALLAGCLSNDDDQAAPESTPTPDDSEEPDESNTPEKTDTETADENEQSGDTVDSIPSELATILQTVPETVADYGVRSLWLISPAPNNDRSPGTGVFGDIESQLGVAPEKIDRMGTALFGDYGRTIGVFVGSFSADEVTQAEQSAMHVEDGFVIQASRDGQSWETGLDAALEATDTDDSGLNDEPVSRALRPLAEDERIILRTNTGQQSDNGLPESVEMFSYGASLVDNLHEEITITALFDDSSAATDDAITELAATSGFPTDEMDISTTQDLVVGSVVQDIPDNRLPDNSPDAQFVLTQNGTVLRQVGTEAVDTGRLEVLIDGEPVTAPWEGRDAPIEPDEEFDIDAEVFRVVEVLWHDPNNEGVTQTLGQGVVGGENVFSGEYESTTKEVTITYTGDMSVQAERFRLLTNRSQAQGGNDGPLSEYVGETLDSGDSFTVSDIGYGGSVSVSLNVEGEGPLLAQTVFAFSPEPPGDFGFEYHDGSLTITYDGNSMPADKYRIRQNRDEAPVQFSDVHDQLAAGDSIEMDAAIGDTIQIAWRGEDQEMVLTFHTVLPDIEFTIAYDEDATELTLTHAGGPSTDSENLDVVIITADAEQRGWPADGTVSEGDEVSIDLETDETLNSVSVIYDNRGALASKRFGEQE